MCLRWRDTPIAIGESNKTGKMKGGFNGNERDWTGRFGWKTANVNEFVR